MIQNVLTHLGGIGLYGVISLCLFCTVFVGVLAWTFVLRRAHVDRMARIPLEDDAPDELSVRRSQPLNLEESA
jgi:cbb3-type cytochrome oxidase subunit 3